ncbi:MAG: hypothetical protein IJ905_11750 [Fibrobacter sp.]|nr:hypothetical protein [Fibrobacter sp.]
MPILSLDLSEAQASPKGKTRNEVRVLATLQCVSNGGARAATKFAND